MALWHSDVAWSKLETQKVGEDNTYIYYDAKTTGFGPFVIAANNESTNMNSSGSKDENPISPANSGAKKTSEPDKPSDKRMSLPGFESAISVCLFGAAYYFFRRIS